MEDPSVLNLSLMFAIVPDMTDNDIMLIFLDRPVKLDYVKFASVTDEYIGKGEKVQVVGWGAMGGSHDDEISSSADMLQEIELTTITNEKCERARGKMDGSMEDYEDQITSSMMCAE